jgi:hypothetical protein
MIVRKEFTLNDIAIIHLENDVEVLFVEVS